MKTAKIHEIFESIQGEGPYTGAKQLFIRFFGCDIGCAFCDTPQEDYREYSSEALRDEVAKYSGFHSISLTGGEPLIQVDFLEEFLKDNIGLARRIYLETNGIMPDALLRIIDYVDIVSMDFKLPSVAKTKDFWKAHEDFLKIALKREVFVKMVIDSQTSEDDILTARSIIKRVCPQIPVVFQPSGIEESNGFLEKMMSFRRDFVSYGIHDAKILPQMHKIEGIR